MLVTLQPSVFFFPRENQKCAWNVFSVFFWFFSRTKNRFHAHFFATFHGQSKCFTGIFLDFFTYGILISRGENRYFWKFSRMAFIFSRTKKILRIYSQSRANSKPVDDVVQIIFQQASSKSDGSFSSFLLKKKVHTFSIVTQFLKVFFPLTLKTGRGEGG